MILYPAFRIQQSMMLSTMGVDWWTSRRAALADGRKKERRDSDREVARRKKHAAKMKKREELRAKYDKEGKQALEETGLVDSSHFFAMLFGSEPFEYLIGAPPRRLGMHSAPTTRRKARAERRRRPRPWSVVAR